MLYFGVTAVFGVTSTVSAYSDLGYPGYFPVILGIAKILGVIAIFTGRITWLKEWAYAGFTFDFLAVIGSVIAVHITFFGLLLPAIFLVILHFSYHFWKRLSEIHGIAYTRVF